MAKKYQNHDCLKKAECSIHNRIANLRQVFYLFSRKNNLLFIISILTLQLSCRNQTHDSIRSSIDMESLESGKDNVRLIFYNIYLPTEMSLLFERVGANYNPSIMNSNENISRYTDPISIAANIGIYGVDLNYAKIYNQTQVVARYVSSVNILAGKLGIPYDYYEDLLKNLESNYNDKDSITKIVSDLYLKTDKFLKSEQKNSYAALIVLGGWVEALYIAAKIYENDPGNIEIMERIAEQKYSLNSLIALLNNYQDENTIASYILMLKTLKKSYDQIQILYEPENFKIDTLKSAITFSGHESEITPEIIREITHVISNIRAELVK